MGWIGFGGSGLSIIVRNEKRRMHREPYRRMVEISLNIDFQKKNNTFVRP